MSSWAKMLKNFERTVRSSNGSKITSGTPGAIKFLKTNPTRHQVLHYAKKAVDRVPRADMLGENTYDEFQDAISILDESRKELGISSAFERALRDVESGFNNPKLLKGQARKFYTQYKKEMAKPNRNFVKVSYNVSRAAEKWKIGKTKVVNGKRVKRTETELKKLIANKKKTCEDRHGKWHHYCIKK